MVQLRSGVEHGDRRALTLADQLRGRKVEGGVGVRGVFRVVARRRRRVAGGESVVPGVRLWRVGEIVQLGIGDERIADDGVELGLRARAVRRAEQVDVGVGLVEEAFLHLQTVAGEVYGSYPDPRRQLDDDLAGNEILRL
jgi:hypothetical protein